MNDGSWIYTGIILLPLPGRLHFCLLFHRSVGPWADATFSTCRANALLGNMELFLAKCVSRLESCTLTLENNLLCRQVHLSKHFEFTPVQL